jgi:CubicO group peptidase (beta-lactamase class C family)
MMIGAAIFRLVEQGVMSLDDNPQDYISWWTNDPADPRSHITLEQLLSQVSGFNDRPITGACPKGDPSAADDCIRDLYEGGLGSTPGEEFHYGPEHLDVAQHMAALATGMTFDKLLEQEIAAPLGLSSNTFLGSSSDCQPSACEPFMQSEAYSTAADYTKFLQALFTGNVVENTAAFTMDRTQSAIFVYRPASNVPGVGDWHYALGSWRECDLSFFSGACINEVTFSSPGAFGWTPWIDFNNGYYALIAHEDPNILDSSSSLSEALQLEQSLQPVIEGVLANN